MKPASRIVRAISFGVFFREAPSTSAIILSRKLSPGWVVTITLIWSESTFVPPVTELLSPPASRITGADSPVIALSSIEARPSIISPSDGIVSPASQIKISPFFNLELLTTETEPFEITSLAGVSSRVLRKLSAWALPRASAIASAKLAKSRVRNNTTKTNKLYPNVPWFSAPVAAAQMVTTSMTNVTISTINMIGLRNIVRGSNLANDCFMLSITSSFGNKEADLFSFILFFIKLSAN